MTASAAAPSVHTAAGRAAATAVALCTGTRTLLTRTTLLSWQNAGPGLDRVARLVGHGGHWYYDVRRFASREGARGFVFVGTFVTSYGAETDALESAVFEVSEVFETEAEAIHAADRYHTKHMHVGVLSATRDENAAAWYAAIRRSWTPEAVEAREPYAGPALHVQYQKTK